MITVEEFKQIISQENMSRVQLAEEIGISTCALVHILSGRCKPTLEMQQKIDFYCTSKT
jgi:transcriptional regulator with XRE-family HTH domain